MFGKVFGNDFGSVGEYQDKKKLSFDAKYDGKLNGINSDSKDCKGTS